MKFSKSTYGVLKFLKGYSKKQWTFYEIDAYNLYFKDSQPQIYTQLHENGWIFRLNLN